MLEDAADEVVEGNYSAEVTEVESIIEADEVLKDIALFYSGLIKVKNRLMQEDKDIRSSDYVMVDNEFVSEETVSTTVLREKQE